MPMRIPLIAVLCVALASGDSLAQEPAQIRVNVELVNLFVTVRDRQGQPVPDLTHKDFRVFEDGRQQKVEYFTRDSSLPLTLALLLDTSGSQRNLLAAEQDAALRFFDRTLRSGDEAMVVTFDLDVSLPGSFSSDRAALERAVRRARIRMPEEAKREPGAPPGGTVLFDAIARTCRERLAQRGGRKALVIITDAEDTGSRASFAEALDTAQRHDAILHIVLITQRAGFGFGRQNEQIARKLAGETGGRVVTAAYASDLDPAFDQIAEELRSQYILGYTPTNRARDGRWRKLRVETTRRGARPLTRNGYYAPSK
jgi:VWFA-related protein